MPLSPHFPTDPFAILDPGVRWYPGDELLIKTESAKLIPPLVEKVRKGVKAWRDVWGAGQGVGTIADAPATADLVARLARDYAAARARMAGVSADFAGEAAP